MEIQVYSREELVERIYRDKVNVHPVHCHWTYRVDEISFDKKAVAEINPELPFIR